MKRGASAVVVLLALARSAAAADLEARVLDGAGAPVDVVRRGLTLPRTPPAAAERDPDGFSILLLGEDPRAGEIALTSSSESGVRLDVLSALPSRETPCPRGTPSRERCWLVGPLRLAIDATDRQHPVARARSLIAELGGVIRIAAGGREIAAVRVLGPEDPGAAPIERLRAKLRVFLVRERAHGGPPFGVTDPLALGLARAQIRRANAVWGQCGVSFGRPEDAEVRVVDPPPPHLLAIGCDLGLPASGGEVRVRAEGRDVVVATHRGDSPRIVAHRLAAALEGAQVAAIVSHNLPIGPGADGTSDVLVRRRGAPGTIERASSTDPTMRVCLGVVDLSDGLQHFSDVDAVAGTVEERALLKALDDGDPRTIEVVFVPSFSTGGRIGESFIKGDRSSLPSMVIEDRAGVRADDISFALAHELGHVLLDVPGHSDDFGVDTPNRLMDSDAADSSAFGPRRLDANECARAMKQSGPSTPTPLLLPWPVAPLAGR